MTHRYWLSQGSLDEVYTEDTQDKGIVYAPGGTGLGGAGACPTVRNDAQWEMCELFQELLDDCFRELYGSWSEASKALVKKEDLTHGLSDDRVWAAHTWQRFPPLSTCVSLVLSGSLKLHLENRQQQRLKSTHSRYVCMLTTTGGVCPHISQSDNADRFITLSMVRVSFHLDLKAMFSPQRATSFFRFSFMYIAHIFYLKIFSTYWGCVHCY